MTGRFFKAWRLHLASLLLMLTIVSSSSHSGTAYALDVPLKPTASPIVDKAEVLSDQEEAALAQKLAAERTATGNQIGILTIPSLEDAVLEEYSLAVARGWGIGTKERDSGVLLFVAVEDRKVRIEVGYGLEGALTDARAGRIIRDRMAPAFRQQQYNQGITAGVDGIISAIHGEVDPALSDKPASSGLKLSSLPIEGILFGLFFLPAWLASMLARTKSWWAGGMIGAVIGTIIGVFFGFMFIGILSIIGLLLAGLLLDFAVSRNFEQRRADGMAPSWWAGGTHIGGSGGGGGFGGFDGGGFGGGGASGDW